jgi:hypothetical protein
MIFFPPQIVNYTPAAFIELLINEKQQPTKARMDSNLLILLGSGNYYINMNSLIDSYRNISELPGYSFIDVAPNETAVSNALNFVKLLDKYGRRVDNLGPFPDGGILFELSDDDNYLSVEFYNENEIVALTKSGNEKHLRQITEGQLESVLKTFIRSESVAV